MPSVQSACSAATLPGPVITVLKIPSPPKSIFFTPRHRLHFDLAGACHGCKVSRVHNNLLSGCKFIFFNITIKFRNAVPLPESFCIINPSLRKVRSRFSAERTRTDPRWIQQQEMPISARSNPVPVQYQTPGLILGTTMQTRSSHSRSLPCSGLRKYFPRKRSSKHLADAATSRLHFHIRGHPRHGTTLRNHYLSLLQIADYNWKRFSLNRISHNALLPLLRTPYIRCPFFSSVSVKAPGRSSSKVKILYVPSSFTRMI